MGVMNKMKTVDLGTLEWKKAWDEGITWITTSVTDAKRPPTEDTIARIHSDTYPSKSVTQVYRQRNTGDTGIAIRDTNGFVYVNTGSADVRPSGILTYETVDSVEEKIVSYHAPQLVKDDDTLVKRSGITATFSGATHRLQISGTATDYFSRGNQLSQVARLKPRHRYVAIITGVVSQGLFLNYNNTINYAGLGTSSSLIWTGETTGAVCYIGSNIYSGEIASTDATIQIVDLTELYGAGNEPASVDTFLQQHPEYNSYVPFNDGPTNIAEDIMKKMKTVDLGTLGWRVNPYVDNAFSAGLPSAGTYAKHSEVDGYTYSTSSADKTWFFANANNILFVDASISTPQAFKQAMQGVLLTYETIDSVEE